MIALDVAEYETNPAHIGDFDDYFPFCDDEIEETIARQQNPPQPPT